MKILVVHNQDRSLISGAERVIDNIMRLLMKNGHEIKYWMRTSRGIENSLYKKMCAFWSGIYNLRSYTEMRSLLKKEHFDIVHVHNIYPLLSPSVLVASRKENVPVIMSVHSSVLTCPKGNNLYKDQVCERCVGGRDYRCIIQNCRENIFESVAYALRYSFARTLKLFQENVSYFIALTEFGKKKLIDSGFSEEKIVVIPNMVCEKAEEIDPSQGKYIAFAGRFSSEKGVFTLLEAARLTQLPIYLAGDGPLMVQLQKQAPRNAVFLGQLDRLELAKFYQKARFLVFPSTCFEGGPLVVVEAMIYGLPVIASRIGGIPEAVEDGVTGLLFNPGDAQDLAKKINQLWQNPELCRKMGKAGRKKAIANYNENSYYEKIMGIYLRALKSR